MTNVTPLMRLFLVLAGVMAAMLGWQTVSADVEVPPGCAQVFAATTRGGAQIPSGGGCNLFRGNTDGIHVLRVIDGDTIVVSGNRHVRYIGIDTPEVHPQLEPLGREATDYNMKLLRGGAVRLEKDVSETDRFGRLLRYVHADGILVEAELVREGLALAIRYPPDIRYAVCLEALQEEARQARRGLWEP